MKDEVATQNHWYQNLLLTARLTYKLCTTLDGNVIVNMVMILDFKNLILETMYI